MARASALARARAGERVPGRASMVWSRPVAWLIDHVYLATYVIGRKNVPAKGAVILAGNHVGVLDGPIVLGASPRGVHFLIKAALARGLGGAFLLAAGQIPVAREGGRQALATCLKVLQSGRVVGIFPEGTRGGGRAEAIHPGVAWLAVNSGAPVVPFACLGTRLPGESISHWPRLRRRVVVDFGPPIDLSGAADLRPRGAAIAAVIDRVQAALSAHVAEASTRARIPLP
jgi:1-acyl-sn-glycerol-3-phosphate acyltransferase